MTTPGWTTYASIVLVLLGLLWSAAGQWFELKHDVAELKRLQRYSHGDLSSYVKE